MALTAWATAFTLLYGILYPVQPRNIAGVRVQGLLPARLSSSAAPLASLVAKQFVAAAGQLHLEADGRVAAAMRPLIETHLDTYLRVRLREKMPVIASFIGDSTMLKLRESMIEEIDTLLPQVIAQYISSPMLEGEIETTVKETIEGISATKLEEMIGPALRQARTSVPMGFAVAGLCIGGMVSAVAYCVK